MTTEAENAAAHALAKVTAERTGAALNAFCALAVSRVDFAAHARSLRVIERMCREQGMHDQANELGQSAHVVEAAHAFMLAARTTPLIAKLEKEVLDRVADTLHKTLGGCQCENCKANRVELGIEAPQKEQVH